MVQEVAFNLDRYLQAVRSGRAEAGYGSWVRMTSIGGAAQTQSGTSEEMLVGGSSGAVDSNEHFPDMQDGQARIDQDTELQNVRTSSQQGAFILHSENPTSSSASSQVEVDVALNGPTAESECSDDAQTVRAVCAALTMVGPVADDTLPLPSGSDESRTDNLVEVDTSPLDAGSSDASMLKPTLEVLSPHSPVLDENPPLRSSDRGEASMQSYEPSELDELESDGEQDDQSPQRNRIEPDEQPAEQLQPTSPSERDELEEVEDHNVTQRRLRSASRAAAPQPTQSATQRRTRSSSRPDTPFTPISTITASSPLVRVEREKRNSFLKGRQLVTSICTSGMRSKVKLEDVSKGLNGGGKVAKGKSQSQADVSKVGREDTTKRKVGRPRKNPVASESSTSRAGPSNLSTSKEPASKPNAAHPSVKQPRVRKRSNRRTKREARREKKAKMAKVRAAKALIRQREAERQRQEAERLQQQEAETRQQQEVETRQQEEEESQVEVVEEQVAEVRPLPEEQEAVAAGIEATDDEFDHLDDDLILQAVEDGQDEASVEAVLPSREASMLAPSAGGTMSSIAPPPSTPSAPSAPSTQSTSKASVSPSIRSTPPTPLTSSALPVTTTATTQPVAPVAICNGSSQSENATQLSSQPVIPRTKEDRPSPEPNANAQPNPSSASTRNQTQHVRSSKEPESFNEAYLEFGQLTSNQKQLYIILPTTDDLLTRPVDKGYPSHPTSNEPHQKPVDKGKRRQISEEPIETSSSEEHDDDDDDGDVVRTESQHKRGSGSRPHKRVHANGSSASDSGRERGRVVVENEEDETYRELNMATINLEGENDNSDDETYIPDNDAVTMSGDEIVDSRKGRRRRSLPATGARKRGSPVKHAYSSQGVPMASSSAWRGTLQGDSMAASPSKRRKVGNSWGEIIDATGQNRTGRPGFSNGTHGPIGSWSRQQEVVTRNDGDGDSLLAELGVSSESELYKECLAPIRAESKQPILDDAMQSDAFADPLHYQNTMQTGTSPSALHYPHTQPATSSSHNPSPSTPSNSAPLRVPRPHAHTQPPPSPIHSAPPPFDAEKMQHLVRRILDDAHIMKSAAEEALFEFVNSQKAHDRMSQDLALLGHDTSGQSAKLNEYAQLLSAYSRYADMLASRVEAALVFGAESIPRLQLEEVRGLSRR